MRRTVLAGFAMAFVSATATPVFAQGATGGGIAPAQPDTKQSTPTTGTPAQTSGAAGSGTTPSDKGGAGANVPNAVGKQAPDAPKQN